MSTTTPIDDVLARLSDAWNGGDSAAYAEQFTADATYVAFNGEVLRGRAAIDDVHRRLFDGPLRSSRMVAAPDSPAPEIRFVRPDVAVVVSSGAVQPTGAAELAADRVSVQSYVVVEDGDAWRVAAFQNTRRQPR